jgi:hypothetical protein
MVEQSKDHPSFDENILSDIFTVSNKKFIHNPIQERRALVESMGQKLIIEENNEQ